MLLASVLVNNHNLKHDSFFYLKLLQFNSCQHVSSMNTTYYNHVNLHICHFVYIMLMFLQFFPKPLYFNPCLGQNMDKFNLMVGFVHI